MLFMNKFTKNVTAFALSALVAGPAAALEFDTLHVGEKAEVKFSGANCDGSKFNKLDIMMYMYNTPFNINPGFLDYTNGPNTGIYETEILGGFGVGEDFFGFGTFIISKNGKKVADAPKKATLGMSAETFLAFKVALEAYGIDKCKKFDIFQADLTQITKNAVEWSKGGDRLNGKLTVETQYTDDGGKDKKIKVNIKTGKMDRVLAP
jgi:hypothetical protein